MTVTVIMIVTVTIMTEAPGKTLHQEEEDTYIYEEGEIEYVRI